MSVGEEVLAQKPASKSAYVSPFVITDHWWAEVVVTGIPIPVAGSGQTSTHCLLSVQNVNISLVWFLFVHVQLPTWINFYSDHENEQWVDVYQVKDELHAIAIIKPRFPIKSFV